jgi:hypothetical protein
MEAKKTDERKVIGGRIELESFSYQSVASH